MPLIIIFFIIPLVEVYAFMTVGGTIGVLPTLLLCIATAIIGGFLVRLQGISMLMSAQENLRTGKMPVEEIFGGLCVVIAGVLLLTPGFFTDTIGFLLLFPPFRAFLKTFLAKKTNFTVNSGHSAQQTHNRQGDNDNTIIEGDYERVEKDAPPLEQTRKDD